MKNYLVTGAARGIGLALIRQLIELPTSEVGQIFAATRTSPTQELKNLLERSKDRVHHVYIDLQSNDSVVTGVRLVHDKLSKTTASPRLDVLINNAGVCDSPSSRIHDLSSDALASTLATNLTGCHCMIRESLTLLLRGSERKIINLASTLGSFATTEDTQSALFPAYKISKAALNMLTLTWALDLRDQGFTIVSLSPGRVATDLAGREGADLSVEQSAKGIIMTCKTLSSKDNGTFKDLIVEDRKEGKRGVGGFYDGRTLPW